MKIVVIEWDGKQPPTTYYNGLRRLHLKVRGDKDQDPLARRARLEDHSVIAQEGAVLVESDSLARQVAYLAKDCGARTVMIGDCELSEDTHGRKMTEAELEVVSRFDKAFRKRGRPVEGENEDRTWVVSCPECSRTSVVNSDRLVIQCPNCGGLRAASRVGYRHVFSHFPSDLEEWKNMFFVEGYFETPEFSVDSKESIKNVDLSENDLTVYEGLKESNMVQDYLVPRMDNPSFRSLVNMIFLARRYFTAKDRQFPRTKMVVDLLERGVSPNLIPLLERNEYDVLDACVVPGQNNLIQNFYLSLKGD
jgi:ribosomal protein S27E